MKVDGATIFWWVLIILIVMLMTAHAKVSNNLNEPTYQQQDFPNCQGRGCGNEF